MISFCVLALNLLVAIPFVATQETFCEIMDFTSEDISQVAPCESGDIFTWTSYELEDEENLPIKLREDSMGLLVGSGSFCGIFFDDITFTETTGVFIPVFSTQPLNLHIEFIDPQDEANKRLELDMAIPPNEWDSFPLPNIFSAGSADLPGIYKVKIFATTQTPEGKVYFDFIQLYNTDYEEEICLPRDIDPDPEVTEPTEPTEPPTTEEVTTEEVTTEEVTTEEVTTEEITTEEVTTEEVTTEESTGEPTEETEEPPTEETEEPPTEETEEPPTEETEEPPTDPSPTDPPATDPPTMPEPQGEPEWKVVAAIFISLFCGACVLIMVLIFKPFLVKSSPASTNLVTNEHPMSRTTLPRLQVDSGSSGISGVNRQEESTWP